MIITLEKSYLQPTLLQSNIRIRRGLTPRELPTSTILLGWPTFSLRSEGGGGQSILHLIIGSLKIQIASHSVTNVKENIYFSIPAIRSLLFVIQKPGGNFSKTGAQTDLIKWTVLSGSNYYFNFLFNSYSPQLLYVAMQWNWTECQSVFVKYRIQGLWLRCQRAAVDQMKTKRRK